MTNPEPGSSDRRSCARGPFDPPLPAEIGRQRVLLLDASTRGLVVSHGEPIGSPGQSCLMMLKWATRTVVLRCSIERTEVQLVGKAAYGRSMYHSGLRVVNPIGSGAVEALRQLLVMEAGN